MGEMVASTLAQEGVSRVFSSISTKLDDRASRAHNVRRLDIALSRMEYAFERTAKMPITCVSLLRRWKMLMSAYNEGVHLLNKHKLPAALEGHAETGQVVVRSSYYYLQRIATAAYFSLSSLASGLNKQQCLSSSVVQIFEGYADSADKFVADVESACPLRRDTFFPYPFVRQLLQGRSFIYPVRVEGSLLLFGMNPVVLEGRGVEACIWYKRFYSERLDGLLLVLRLSESTDIVGAAIDCVRSFASLLNLPAQEAIIGHLTQLPNLQEISDSYAPPRVRFEKNFASLSTGLRPDPLCCQRVGHGPSVNGTNSSELSHLFQEQIIYFSFSCYVSALEYNLPSTSDEALRLNVGFSPHAGHFSISFVAEAMRSKYEHFPFGSIEQTVDMTRSRSVEFLIGQPEVKDYTVFWKSRHGHAFFEVVKPRIDMAAVPKASGSRYNTRSAAAKRKRS
ncbi:hypothetical protein PVAP13_2KG022000 [Panicum virgatum]|uniref:Uncharacterized protein n=1 Tax=Panicum virgatum TaxID=38727 RepID=A0A8T0W8R5_PANVG|nr:hypothetical protein PVAP13_2KG022000 [Panicum virgatum]